MAEGSGFELAPFLFTAAFSGPLAPPPLELPPFPGVRTRREAGRDEWELHGAISPIFMSPMLNCTLDREELSTSTAQSWKAEAMHSLASSLASHVSILPKRKSWAWRGDKRARRR